MCRTCACGLCGMDGGDLRIYVASSWRNTHQPAVVQALREDGHEVFDFRGEEGFSWREVDDDWLNWKPQQYLSGLIHPCAERGFNRDMTALIRADACVMVMPCGMSASLETGWAKGAGKPTFVYVPDLREPDLMVKMADCVTSDLSIIRALLRGEKVGGCSPEGLVSSLAGVHTGSTITDCAAAVERAEKATGAQ